MNPQNLPLPCFASQEPEKNIPKTENCRSAVLCRRGITEDDTSRMPTARRHNAWSLQVCKGGAVIKIGVRHG